MPTRTWACYLPAELISVMVHKKGFLVKGSGREDNLTVVNVPDHPEHRPLLQHPVDLIKRLVRGKPVRNPGQKTKWCLISPQKCSTRTH